jgi:hypothetical protein
MSQLSLDPFLRGRRINRMPPPPPRMTSAPVTPTRESRQPSQPILDVEDDGIDPDKLEATAANIRLDDDVKARYLASLEAAKPTNPSTWTSNSPRHRDGWFPARGEKATPMLRYSCVCLERSR